MPKERGRRRFLRDGAVLAGLAVEGSCSERTGVPVSVLLKESVVQKGWSWLIAEGADPKKHARSIPREKAMNDALVVYGQNGEAVRPAFTVFRLPWNWNGEETVLQSRCTDERGDVQPSLAEFGKIYGITSMEFWWTSTNPTEHFNAIQPWKITRDGKVHNALLS